MKLKTTLSPQPIVYMEYFKKPIQFAAVQAVEKLWRDRPQKMAVFAAVQAVEK